MMLIKCECGHLIPTLYGTVNTYCDQCKRYVDMYGKPYSKEPKFPTPVGVMDLDDMLEAGDDTRFNVEVHGLIGFFLNNTYDKIDLEAECLEIIRKKYLNGKITRKIMREFYDYLHECFFSGGDCDYCKCSECENYYKEEDTFLCECDDERVCEDCCGNRDCCENCWKPKAIAEADWVDAEIKRRKEEELF